MIPWQTIQEIAELKEEAELTELGWKAEDFEVKLSSSSPGAVVPSTTDSEPQAVRGAKPRSEGAPAQDWIAIEAPMVGTFYEAPAPDAEPFVQPGDKVTYSTTVCIIEAMKLMNEIEAECKGTIKKVCKEDAEPVSKGDPLFYVDPA